MSQVTEQSLSANNSRLEFLFICWPTPLWLHIITWVCPQCKTSRPTTKVTGTWGFILSGTVQDLQWLALNKFWNCLWIFWFSQWQTPYLSIITGLKLRQDQIFPQLVEKITGLYFPNFLKKPHWPFVLFLSKKMYSQNDETGISDHDGHTLIFFFKILSMAFTIQWWHSRIFLKNEKNNI